MECEACADSTPVGGPRSLDGTIGSSCPLPFSPRQSNPRACHPLNSGATRESELTALKNDHALQTKYPAEVGPLYAELDSTDEVAEAEIAAGLRARSGEPDAPGVEDALAEFRPRRRLGAFGCSQMFRDVLARFIPTCRHPSADERTRYASFRWRRPIVRMRNATKIACGSSFTPGNTILVS